ncbi:DUF3304 domain-containing protein [Piscinibacter sp. HJYY11]|uniref:DUF3304 domain-containing protein n=1 Tax=Piscinibacter sp. HJYY11 TaxID=2801333 RepID=UPI00191FB19B|nr:DUF3304 domain-containing protein [Piscinibacter sp. HJYY11]MBL0727713.1 DUF3304 domain-containing protein [Piscinibacter sp. HJYY11]
MTLVRFEGQPARRLAGRGLGVMVVAVAIGQAGCSHPPAVPAEAAAETPRLVAIHGFNYTDAYIDQFWVSVDGATKVRVTAPRAASGRTVCCLALRRNGPLPEQLQVAWARVVDGREHWCSRTVRIERHAVEQPDALAVHFLPDDRVEVTTAQGYPRLTRSVATVSPVEGDKAECRTGGTDN